MYYSLVAWLAGLHRIFAKRTLPLIQVAHSQWLLLSQHAPLEMGVNWPANARKSWHVPYSPARRRSGTTRLNLDDSCHDLLFTNLMTQSESVLPAQQEELSWRK
jgi:hypothetical protein